jgi:hypothetical protein
MSHERNFRARPGHADFNFVSRVVSVVGKDVFETAGAARRIFHGEVGKFQPRQTVKALPMNLNADRIAPSPPTLSPDGGEGEDFASHAVHGFKARRFHSENSLPGGGFG